MCSMHKKLDELRKRGEPYELSVPLMKDLISQANDMKIKEVFLVGGEPFIEEGIFDVIKYASMLGMRTTVTTNGVLLNNKKIDSIFDSGLLFLTFSIDGPDKETYRRIRGENAFKRVIENLKNLISKKSEKKLGRPQITILCTVMKQNIDKLPEMVKFVKHIGVDLIGFQPVVPDNTDQCCDSVTDTWIDSRMYKILDNTIDDLIELKKNEFSDFIMSSLQQLMLMKSYFRKEMPKVRNCYIGFNRLMVTQDHKLYFCTPDPFSGYTSFGDVSKTPLRELWKSGETKKFRKYIKKCKRPCLLFCAYRPDLEPDFDKFNDKLIKE